MGEFERSFRERYATANLIRVTSSLSNGRVSRDDGYRRRVGWGEKKRDGEREGARLAEREPRTRESAGHQFVMRSPRVSWHEPQGRDCANPLASSTANIPPRRSRKLPAKVTDMLIKETSLRYYDSTLSRPRIDPVVPSFLSLSLSLSPSLSLSLCTSHSGRLVGNPEIAHAHCHTVVYDFRWHDDDKDVVLVCFACFPEGDFDRSLKRVEMLELEVVLRVDQEFWVSINAAGNNAFGENYEREINLISLQVTLRRVDLEKITVDLCTLSLPIATTKTI